MDIWMIVACVIGAGALLFGYIRYGTDYDWFDIGSDDSDGGGWGGGGCGGGCGGGGGGGS